MGLTHFSSVNSLMILFWLIMGVASAYKLFF